MILNRVHLKRKLHNLNMKETSPAKECLNKFNFLINRLKFVGVKIDEKKNIVLLCSTQDSWDWLIMNLDNTVYLSFEFNDF